MLVRFVCPSDCHVWDTGPQRQHDLWPLQSEVIFGFLEEMIDAFNYYLAILVMAGVDSEEFLSAFKYKHNIIMDRLITEV